MEWLHRCVQKAEQMSGKNTMKDVACLNSLDSGLEVMRNEQISM